MSATDREKFDNPVIEWIDSRLPIFTMIIKEYGIFQMPKNCNYMWSFGGMALVMLLIMIGTGVILAMHYTPHADMAFDSVERIMRDVNYGWLIRYTHMNGASFFFIAVYIHMARGLYFGSYQAPREILWIVGVIIFLLMMATAFMGYALPWSQMSGWGVNVITNLFSAFPIIGDPLVTWLWGGFSVDNPTLNRFFALHFLLPFVILGVVFIHVWALHVTGSNNPTGVEPKTKDDTIPFHPYFTSKDSFAIVMFLAVFLAITFFAPLALSEVDHFEPYNPLKTPPHIVPEWYFLPFYAILKSFTMDISIPGTSFVILDAKLQGVLAMFGSIILLMFLPWLDGSAVKSAGYRPLYKTCLILLLISMFALGYAGMQPPEGLPVIIGKVSTVYYFLHFLVLLPLLSRFEKPRPVPESISASMKKKIAAIAMIAVIGGASLPAYAATDAAPPPYQSWPHHGMLGTYDKAAVQRGFQVYKEVCAACHSLEHLHYRNLGALGYSEEQIKAVAAEYTVQDGPDDLGMMFERPARPSDKFAAPFPNEQAARAANNGALPPDLSLIVKSRKRGEDYLYSLLTGYIEPPAFDDHGHPVKMADGMHYNKYFPGHQIAMAAPLTSGQVTYSDDTSASVAQAARDVTQFLAWAGEPHADERKQTGLKILLYLLTFAAVLYALKRQVWADVH